MRFSSYVGNCRNIFWKAYCIGGDYPWCSLDMKYLTKKVSKRNLTFSSLVFGNFAHKFVQCIFETLPVASRFNLEPMDFVINGLFRKVYKLGLCCSKLRKFGIFGTFVVNFEELYFTFFRKLCFECPIVSMIMSMEVPIHKSFRN